VNLIFFFDEFARLTPPLLGEVVWQGIWMQAITAVSWFEGLKRVPLAKATAIVMAFPIVTLIASAALLGESINLAQILAVALTLAGLVLLARTHLDSIKQRPIMEGRV
jgi:drug/metabolite transporter (DMT)-like permease